MNRPVRIAVQIAPQHGDYRGIRAAAVRAEEKGADIIYNWDHFYPLWGDPDGKHFECWTMLASWAEVTERVEFGPLVTCFSYRNPHLLADMARTVDHISGGRLILGLGGGWAEKDYREYEYPFGTFGGRLRDLDTGLYKIKRRMKRLNPPPVRDIPVLVGGQGEQHTLRSAGRYADIWHSFNVEALPRKNRILDDWCRAAGRDPSEIERAIGVDLGDLDKADRLLEAGATQITLSRVEGPDFDMPGLEDWIAWRDEKNASLRLI